MPEKMKMLSRDVILQADDLPQQVVSVPEWGGHVTVRTLIGTERDEYEQEINNEKKGSGRSAIIKNIRASLCARTIITEDGSPMFSKADVHALGAKSAKALDRIFAVAQNLNGLGPDDIEELAKNSETDRSDASDSA